MAALAAFGACLGGAFVFDDFGMLRDRAITSSSGWLACWRLTQTRPLTWFSFWASYQVGGANPVWWHVVSLVLHLLVATLVWDVLRRLIPERAALIAAVIFAVHPMVTEPAAYAFARGTLLATLFSLLAVRSWVTGRAWWAVGWFFVAMLAKEECAALPVFLLGLDWWLEEKSRVAPLAAMFGVAGAMGARVLWAVHVIPGVQAGAGAGISPLGYLAVQGVEVLRYLRMLVVPWGFSVDYSSVPAAVTWEVAAWVGVIVMIGVAVRYWRVGFWFLSGLVLLLPSSSIFPAADLANDRRMYLPLVAFAACVGLLLERVDWRVVVAIVVVLVGISFRYSLLWGNPEALWSEAVLRAPDKLRPRLQLARSVSPDRGLGVLEGARLIAPEDATVPAEQGRILLTLRQPEEALAAFGRALALAPGDAMLLNNRGVALAALGQGEAARADFLRALERDPCLEDARGNLERMGVRVDVAAGCR